jgi:acyl-CoA thioesterase-1
MNNYRNLVLIKLVKVKSTLLQIMQRILRFIISLCQKLGKVRFGLTAGIAVSIALSACGGGQSETSAMPPASTLPVSPGTITPSPSTITRGAWVVMGSSTAAGGGAPVGKGWVSVLQNSLASRTTGIVNLALPGAVTYLGLSTSSTPATGRPAPDPTRNIDQSLSRNPVAIIVAYPTNDVVAGYSLDEIVNNILAIRTTAIARNVPVLVLSTQPRKVSDAQMVELRAIDARLSAAIGPCYVDVYNKLATASGQLMAQYDSGDGTHPNEAGHQIIATTLQQVIDSSTCVVLQ